MTIISNISLFTIFRFDNIFTQNQYVYFGNDHCVVYLLYNTKKDPQYAHVTINTEKKIKPELNEFFTKPKVTFQDVAGLEEVKEELEVIDFVNKSENIKNGCKNS